MSGQRVIDPARRTVLDASRAVAGDVLRIRRGVRYDVLEVRPSGRGAFLVLRGTCAVCQRDFTLTTRRIFQGLVRTCPDHRGQATRLAPMGKPRRVAPPYRSPYIVDRRRPAAPARIEVANG